MSMHIKRGRDTKIPQSSGPPDKGSGPRFQDTILGDVNAQTRFEITSKQSIDPPLSRGYTLGSGEESMKLIGIDGIFLKFAEMHNVVVFLEKPKESDGFAKIIDFLKASSVHYALTVNLVIYTSCIEQFWATAKSSIRRDLHLHDAEGTDCLPTATIFEELARMGSQSPRGNQRNLNGQKSNQLGKDFVMYNKACYICGSFNHLQINCHSHQRRGIVSRNNYNRVDAKNTHPNVLRNMSPKEVLTKTGLTPVNTVRLVNTAHPKTTVHSAKSKTHFSKQAQSTAKRPFYKQTALTRRSMYEAKRHYYTGRYYAVNTARYYSGQVNDVRVKGVNAGKPQHDDKGFVDSGCSRHMTGNIAYLSDFKQFDGGYVAFGGGAYGGKITGKGTLKTDNLDFEDVYFVNELKFNLFSVSQMCDKKNYVLFTDTECLVLSPNFKLPDENQILLKIPRKDNMYSFDMKNIVPKESLTCLVAKATLDESMLWHRRLGHINFKNINKLVKDNLVRGLPTKHFENDQTCIPCLKGKQHRASCKSKILNPITKPLFMLHMDLFGPTLVSSLMHKKYCLVVTDDYSRFTWVFFLTMKDETSEILKSFIKEIENLVDKKVKIIRSDNGTEFKNKVLDDFCREKGIKRQYSVARTPQQNGVAKRRNRILIEADRTVLADSKLPTTFWAEAVSTAFYVQNRVLVVKPHNKTPYELFRGFKPALSFMRPFGCHVTILNTLDSLGKFDGKSDEGFFVGYSLSSKAFRVYNTKTRRVEENLHIGFLENKPLIEGTGPKWLFDIDSLTQSMNYVPVTAGTVSNDSAGTSEENSQDCIVMPIWKDTSYFDSPTKDVDNGEPKTADDAQKQVEDGPNNENVEQERFADDSSTKDVNAVGQQVNTASPDVSTASPNEEDSTEEEPEVDLGNIINSYILPTTPNTRIHKYHPIDNVISEVQSTVQTRRMSKPTSEQGFLSDIKPTSIAKALSDSSWVEAMQEELLQFKLQQVWILGWRADDVEEICIDLRLGALMYLHCSSQISCLQDSSFELVAYTDSDYAGATQDRKSTTGGC
ncbi:putative ribonuclease H-like domain-containing protein [Tanacetum coccineum]